LPVKPVAPVTITFVPFGIILIMFVSV